MQRKLIIGIWCWCLLIIAAGGTVRASDGLSLISDGVYSYVDVAGGSPTNRFGANAGVVVGNDAVLVVDTLTSAKEAVILLEDIRKVTAKPIRYVVNTHYHLDHAFGNCVFADKGAAIISHINCRKRVQQTKDKSLEMAKSFGMDDDALQGTRIIIPDMAFERTLELDLGGRVVRLMYSGHASHTAGSIIVWVPQQKVVFAGDILFTDCHPYLAEGDLAGWAKNLAFLEALHAEKIIPGHGPLSGRQDLLDMKAYLAAFDRNAKSLCATSQDVEKITAEMLKRLPQRKYGQFLVSANIQGRYLKPVAQVK